MQVRILILSFLLLISACSNPNKKTRGSKSNFLAYYNSFYMAEKFFNEAIIEIESMENVDGEITSKAKNLLETSMENALVIQNKFYNFVDLPLTGQVIPQLN